MIHAQRAGGALFFRREVAGKSSLEFFDQSRHAFLATSGMLIRKFDFDQARTGATPYAATRNA
jgi:hypothetical protein